MSELYKALHRVQGVIRGVKRDAKNPHFKNSYATLEQVTDTIRQHMQDAGLIWFQMPGRITDGGIEVTTVIAHAESGEEIRSVMEVPLGKRDPQGAGSALTYGQRYSLMAILGLPPTDDDAETSIARADTHPAPEKSTPPIVEKKGGVSAAQLKESGAWPATIAELDNDLLDVKTLRQFNELRADYLAGVRKDGWPEKWVASLDDEFEKRLQERLAKKAPPSVGEIAADIQTQCPGARVVSEQPLNAG